MRRGGRFRLSLIKEINCKKQILSLLIREKSNRKDRTKRIGKVIRDGKHSAFPSFITIENVPDTLFREITSRVFIDNNAFLVHYFVIT